VAGDDTGRVPRAGELLLGGEKHRPGMYHRKWARLCGKACDAWLALMNLTISLRRFRLWGMRARPRP
jgi:hypothetical protein